MHGQGVRRPGAMSSTQRSGPDATNRVGSFIGPMAASFQVQAPDAPSPGDLATAEAYGKRVTEITIQLGRGRRP